MTRSTIGQDQVQAGITAGNLLGSPVVGQASAQAYKGPCTVTEIAGQNASTTTTYYLQLFDTTTPPTGGEVPLAQAMVNFGVANSPGEKRIAGRCIPIVNGAWLAWSTTPWTYTAAGSGTGLSAEAWGV